MTPRATYRLQFHGGVTFADGARVAPYLAGLGISHLYSSPIQTARRGSTHGYDVVDYAAVNPELGGRSGLEEMAKVLRAHGIGIILDIVPNHMFVGDGSNAWWQDVLEFGRRSHYASHFDIDWDPPDQRLSGKVLLPFLGMPYADTLASGALKLTYDQSLGKLVFAYHDHRLPLRREDYPEILGDALPEAADLKRFNAAHTLHALLERQNYVLSWWKSAGDRINWRRFFDINELAGLKVEQENVFDAVHALPLELYTSGLVDGFRIDHIDGLADPAGYCHRLRARLTQRQKERPAQAASEPAYLVVEKVLARDEHLPADWPLDGTTGYEFLAKVSALQHDPDGEAPLTGLWQRLSRRSGSFEDERRTARLQAFDAFEAQLDTVARTFAEATDAPSERHDVQTLQRAIRGLIANLDTYRTYLTGHSATVPADLERAAARAKSGATPIEREAIEFVIAVLAGHRAANPSITADATRRFNQLAGTIAAKGVEDTAFYRHAVLISRNDVGSDPAQFSMPAAAFHASCARRAESFPRTMLATATHDHKRGEDARARLAVLSEITSRWEATVIDWLELTRGERLPLVEFAECYHLFQTLVGAWPLDLAIEDRRSLEQFRKRILAWRTKSLREAKLRTSWTAIDPTYEAAHADFVTSILDPQRSSRFLASLQNFVSAIAPAGAANALVQTVLRLTTPGVPDTYQGTEFWDFSLVDPDNRRDVDFPARQRALGENADLSGLAKSWRDGRIKQATIARFLAQRASDPALFESGAYMPIATRGEHAGNLVAFARRHQNRVLLVGVTRCCAESLVGGEAIAPPPAWWADTHFIAASIAEGRLRDALRPGRTIGSSGVLQASELLSNLPVFALHAED